VIRKELIFPDFALHGLTGPGGRSNGGFGLSGGGTSSQSEPAPLELFVKNKVSPFQSMMVNVCVMVGAHKPEPVPQLFDEYGCD
jgi:hypothetical protein